MQTIFLISTCHTDYSITIKEFPYKELIVLKQHRFHNISCLFLMVSIYAHDTKMYPLVKKILTVYRGYRKTIKNT